MPSTIKLEIVTPHGIAYSDDVDIVTLRTAEGQIGVLPHHVRLMTRLEPGELIIRKNGQEKFLAMGGGLAEVRGEHISIATDMAVAVENIDEVAVEEARERAARRLHEKISSEEVATVNASLARSLAQLRVKRRHRT
jgi:F-type H+-transporting ATPase subunit epsilon